MAVIINNHDEEVDYEVEGSPLKGSLDPNELISISPGGSSPWTVTFNNDPKLIVSLPSVNDGAMIYEDGKSVATKLLTAA